MSVLHGKMTKESLENCGFECNDNGDMVKDDEMFTIPAEFVDKFVPLSAVLEYEAEFEDFDYILNDDDGTFIKGEWCDDFKRV